jgi:hypothetical protein
MKESQSSWPLAAMLNIHALSTDAWTGALPVLLSHSLCKLQRLPQACGTGVLLAACFTSSDDDVTLFTIPD